MNSEDVSAKKSDSEESDDDTSQSGSDSESDDEDDDEPESWVLCRALLKDDFFNLNQIFF